MKWRWLVLFLVILLILSYFSMSFNVLNPVNGAYETIEYANYTTQSLNVPGLSNNVKVIMDNSGVAHIYANNDHDLFLAQGYYMASNRLFQMEVQSLAASGNLSLWIGSSAISSDQAMRLLGLPENANFLVKAYQNNYSKYYNDLIAFSQGVNDFINTSKLPLNFKLLGVQPFYWSPFYTFAWEEYMTLMLTTGIYEPLESALFLNTFGYENMSLIWPYYPYYTENITMVPGDGTVNGFNLTDQGISPSYLWSLNWYNQWATGINISLLRDLSPLINSALNNISDPLFLPQARALENSIGSNSWIITSDYSFSKFPMLANDPHLNLMAPSVWIPMQLVDPNFNVTGWALAGIPGILIGHTNKTAWGLTTPEGNSANEYLEILKGNEYLYNNSWEKMQIQNYTLLGKKYSIYYTSNGPLISRNGNLGISLSWVAFKPSYILVAELKLDQSQNYSDMLNALKNWGYPPQNFALVSLHSAGYITAGWYPVLNETLPDHQHVKVIGSRTLLNGSLPQFQYSGYVPYNYLPQDKNPQRGYMFAPNQPTVGLNYPYPFIGGFWASGGRAESINAYIKNHPNMNLSDMIQLQSNVSDYWASMLTPYIINAIRGMNMNNTEEIAFNYLNNWNHTAYTDEVGITIYWYTLSEIYNLSINKILSNKGLSGLEEPFESTIIYIIKHNSSSLWLNKNFTMLAREAFSNAIGFLSSKLGNNVTSWQWGKVHKVEISSILGIPALSIGPIPFYGDDHTVSVGSVPFDLQMPEPNVTVSSSLREIAIPGQGIFLGVFPGGPSENVISYYFSNQLPYWLDHEYYNMSKWKEEVEWTYE
ncbi:MAG: penicillin acylase family protein [Thermoplasmata archaeon]